MRVGEALHLINDMAASLAGIGGFVALVAQFAVWAAVGRPGGGCERGALTVGAR